MTSRTEERRDSVEHRYQQGVSWRRVSQSRVFQWGIPSLLLICGVVLLFYRLDQLALLESGEAKYPLVVLMMKIRGNWLVPFRRGNVWLNKPPLTMWLIHVTALLGGGIDEWTARLPSASASLGTVLLVFWWGRRLGGTLFGGIAGFVLLTSGHFLVMGRTSYPDQVFTFFFTLALVTFYAVYHRWWDEKAWWVMYAAMGLATMTKGPMGLVLPMLVISIYLASKRDLSALRRMRWMSGLSIYAAITLPWYLGVLFWYGESPWPSISDNFLVYRPSIRNFPWYFYGYYFVSFPLSFAPWSLLLPGIYMAWRRYREEEGVPDGLRFVAVWWLLFFLIFSIAKMKRPYYLIPILPPASIMVAYVGEYLMTTGKECARWFHRYLQGALAILLALAIGLMILVGLEGMGITGRLLEAKQPLVASTSLIVVPVCLVLVLRHIRRHRYLQSFRLSAVAVFSFWLWAIVFYAPAWDENWSARDVGISLRQMLAPGAEVWIYRYYSDSISVYFGRDITPVLDLEALDNHVKEDVPLYLLARERAVAEILTRYAGQLKACERFYYSWSKVQLVLLSNQPCPSPGGDASVLRRGLYPGVVNGREDREMEAQVGTFYLSSSRWTAPSALG